MNIAVLAKQVPDLVEGLEIDPNGKALDVIAAVDFEVHHQKITEVTVYQADSYQFDEFWADE